MAEPGSEVVLGGRLEEDDCPACPEAGQARRMVDAERRHRPHVWTETRMGYPGRAPVEAGQRLLLRVVWDAEPGEEMYPGEYPGEWVTHSEHEALIRAERQAPDRGEGGL